MVPSKLAGHDGYINVNRTLIPTLEAEIISVPKSERRSWLWFNLLSLDAPLVAVLWQGYFAKQLHADVHWPAFVALAAAVWLIYVADRILDSRRQHIDGSSTARHNFYREHSRLVFRGVAIAGFALAFACYFLSRNVMRNGLVTALLVAIYFLVVHAAPQHVQDWWPKELAVGILFAVGTCLATWTKLGVARDILIAPAALFAILCWLNCVAIEFWEWKRLRNMSSARPHPWTLWIGAHVPGVALSIAAASCGLLAIHSLRPLFGATVLSAFAFLWLDQQSDRFSADALRVLADVTLLTPALLLGLR